MGVDGRRAISKEDLVQAQVSFCCSDAVFIGATDQWNGATQEIGQFDLTMVIPIHRPTITQEVVQRFAFRYFC
jgi:hypothetical protein